MPTLLFSLLSFLLLAACGDGASTPVDNPSPGDPPRGEPPPLIAVLPQTTRAILEVDVGALLSGEAAGAVERLLEGKGSDAALNAPFETLTRYSLGADIAATMDEMLLAQTTDVQDGFLLVAKPKARGLEDLFDLAELSEVASYEGQEIYAKRGTDLLLSLLSDGRLLVGSMEGIRAAVDTLDAEDAVVGASALAPYLSALDIAEPFAFVSGLPALYGEVAVRGSGRATLRHSHAVSGALTFSADSFEGRVRIHSENASDYVARFNELVADTATAPLTVDDERAIVVEIPASSLEKTPEEILASRGLAKQLIHAMDAVDYAEAVMHGGNVPWMNFDVGGDPNSIFINFEFEDQAQIEAFEANELPDGFRLAPIRILDTDEPTYFLVLNIYNSSGGLVAGARAEWSVFIQDPEDAHPRFLVVQAAAENVSADSVNLLTLPESVSHAFDDGDIVSYVGVEDPEGGPEQHYFSSRIAWPQDPEDRVGFAREFVAANDFIYWGNGVSDRTLYNASVHNREAVRIANEDIAIRDDSPWRAYIDPTPKHSYVYLNPLEIVISPWWNLDAEYLDVTAEHRASLIEFKNNFYPAAVLGIAEASVAGEGDALAAYTVGASVPSAYYNFVVSDPDGLARAVGLPEGTRLAAVPLLEGDTAARPYLSLRVYAVDGLSQGNRAEWTVFVEGDDGRPRTLVVDLLTQEATPDPELFLRLPSVVEHERSDQQLRTTLKSEALEFEASIRLDAMEPALPTLDWVEAGDWVCRRNGVCDKVFYAGESMEEPVAFAGRGAVDLARISTPWDAFIATEPSSVFVRQSLQYYARNPWRNIGVAR